MKHARWSALIGLLACFAGAPVPATASEQVETHTSIGQPPMRVFVGAGVSLPISQDFSSEVENRKYNLGTSVRAELGFRVNQYLLLGPDIGYHSFHAENGQSDMNRSVFAFGLSFWYSNPIRMPESRAASAGEQKTAYLLLGGIGMAAVSDPVGDANDPVAWIGGGTIHHFTSHFSVFADLRWEFVFGRKISYLPLVVGISL